MSFFSSLWGSNSSSETTGLRKRTNTVENEMEIDNKTTNNDITTENKLLNNDIQTKNKETDQKYIVVDDSTKSKLLEMANKLTSNFISCNLQGIYTYQDNDYSICELFCQNEKWDLVSLLFTKESSYIPSAVDGESNDLCFYILYVDEININMNIVQEMLRRNPLLLTTEDIRGYIPLTKAIVKKQ